MLCMGVQTIEIMESTNNHTLVQDLSTVVPIVIGMVERVGDYDTMLATATRVTIWELVGAITPP